MKVEKAHHEDKEGQNVERSQQDDKDGGKDESHSKRISKKGK